MSLAGQDIVLEITSTHGNIHGSIIKFCIYHCMSESRIFYSGERGRGIPARKK